MLVPTRPSTTVQLSTGPSLTGCGPPSRPAPAPSASKPPSVVLRAPLEVRGARKAHRGSRRRAVRGGVWKHPGVAKARCDAHEASLAGTPGRGRAPRGAYLVTRRS